MKRLAFCLLLFWIVGVTTAQDTPSRYFWETAGVYIPVPPGWAAPLPLEQNGAPVLLLKPALTGEEAIGSMSIQFKLLPLPETPENLVPLLKTEFEAINLHLAVTQPVLWLNGTALEGFGTDDDAFVYGRGRIVALDTQVLIMMATGVPNRPEDLNALVLETAFGTSTSDVDPGPRPYGVLWQRVSTGADGPTAFIQPQALTAESVDVYVGDRLNGVLAIYAPSPHYVMPWPQILMSAFDASETRHLYSVESEACTCLMDNSVPIGIGFAPTAPFSLATGADGVVYATDIGPDGLAYVRVLNANMEQPSLLFETPLSTQPRLFATPNVLYALTDTGDLLKQEGAGFSPVGTLPVAPNQLLELWDNDTFLTVDETGAFSLIDIDGQTKPFPLSLAPDATLVDMAVTSDMGINKAVYTLEQGTDSGILTSWIQRAVSYGMGQEILSPYVEVTGRFEGTNRHVWIIQGRDDVIDLSAELINPDDTLILGLQLLDSTGNVLGTRTLTPTTASLSDMVSIPLEEAGLYFLVVDELSGSVEQYSFGYHPTYTVLTPEDKDTIRWLSQAAPIQRYKIPATAGQVLTAHVIAISGTLDPSLRLVNPRGTEVEVNEDLDSSLGLDAELTQIRLSNNGDYILEVRATSGEGDFELTLNIEE